MTTQLSSLVRVTVSKLLHADQVTGENINSNATSYWARLVQPCVQTNTPWATVFGNHGAYLLV